MNNQANDRLPRDTVQPARSGDVFRLMLATTVLVLLFNLLCFWYSRNFSANAGYWLVREKWRMLSELDHPVDWMILGDSTGNQGLVPEIWNSTMQTTSINLATIGNLSPIGDLLMLETYIAKFGAPRNVLIVRVYDSWNRSVAPNVIALLPQNHAIRLLWDPRVQCGWKCKLQYLLIRFVPIYSENITFSRLIRRHSKLFETPLRMSQAGYVPEFEPDPERVIADSKFHIETYSGKKFVFSEMNHDSLQRLCELSDRHRFNLYFVSSPLYEGLYRDQRIQPYYRQVWHTLASICAGSSQVNLLPHPVTFSKNEMTSADHLIDSAARKFTRLLAGSIQRPGDFEP